MEIKNFTKQLKSISEAPSVSGNTVYEKITVSHEKVYCTRKSTGKEVSILVEELFNAYYKATEINTTILRDYITGRTFSPALAILLAAGFYEKRDGKYLKVKL